MRRARQDNNNLWHDLMGLAHEASMVLSLFSPLLFEYIKRTGVKVACKGVLKHDTVYGVQHIYSGIYMLTIFMNQMIYLLLMAIYSSLSFSLDKSFRNYVGIEICKVPDHSGLTTDMCLRGRGAVATS